MLPGWMRASLCPGGIPESLPSKIAIDVASKREGALAGPVFQAGARYKCVGREWSHY